MKIKYNHWGRKPASFEFSPLLSGFLIQKSPQSFEEKHVAVILQRNSRNLQRSLKKNSRELSNEFRKIFENMKQNIFVIRVTGNMQRSLVCRNTNRISQEMQRSL